VKVLLLGSGGRESALGWALARSPAVEELISAPGNPGLAEIGMLADEPGSPEAAVSLARHIAADLVVIGPEAPLVAGFGDALREDGFAVFGPDAAAARIEGSKAFAKELMQRAGVPTAAARAFEEAEGAFAYLDEMGPPYVVKADGLAAGKGVVVTEDRIEARAAVEDRLVRGSFGDAGRVVVVEEFLDGEEVSLIAFTDGSEVVPCEPAQDYKRVADGDRGPNTGGMGSYSPVPSCPPPLAERIAHEVIEPMVRATRAAGGPFVGAIYAGLALTSRGPRVIEFNCRFGDPETQVLLPRLDADLAEVCAAAATRELEGVKLSWTSDVCVSVVLASAGYPGTYSTGIPIDGVEAAAGVEGVTIFHAGTARRDDGALVTAGGRVLAVSARGATFAEARSRAYEAAGSIEFEGKHVRSDIARRAEEAERGATP
jgi:phosphoribosylamine---glycine ligase